MFLFLSNYKITFQPSTHPFLSSVFFFFKQTAPTEIYTLPLHDALPIYRSPARSLSSLRERGVLTMIVTIHGLPSPPPATYMRQKGCEKDQGSEQFFKKMGGVRIRP